MDAHMRRFGIAGWQRQIFQKKRRQIVAARKTRFSGTCPELVAEPWPPLRPEHLQFPYG